MKRLLIVFSLLMPVHPSDAQTSSGADAANRHAFELFQLFRQMTPGNFCFSPYSGHRIAALLVEGARGETKKQFLGLTHLPEDAAERARLAEGLRKELAEKSQGLLLDVASSLWVPAGAPIEPHFIATARQHQGALVDSLPSADPVASAARVNRWVRERTHGRISSLVDLAAFRVPDTLVAVNTVFLKATWSHPFEVQRTRIRDFILAGQSRTKLPLMLQKEKYLHSEGAGWQVLEMPLAGQDWEWSMVFILPREDSMRGEVEKGLTQNSLNGMMSQQESIDVNLILPRFSYSTRLDLAGLWQTLGVRDAFDSASVDLGGLSSKPYKLGSVLHEVTIEVNETGAGASAATAVAADPFGDAPDKPKRLPRRAVSFVADHPFLWLIQHRRTGLILFMGRFAGQ